MNCSAYVGKWPYYFASLIIVPVERINGVTKCKDNTIV